MIKSFEIFISCSNCYNGERVDSHYFFEDHWSCHPMNIGKIINKTLKDKGWDLKKSICKKCKCEMIEEV